MIQEGSTAPNMITAAWCWLLILLHGKIHGHWWGIVRGSKPRSTGSCWWWQMLIQMMVNHAIVVDHWPIFTIIYHDGSWSDGKYCFTLKCWWLIRWLTKNHERIMCSVCSPPGYLFDAQDAWDVDAFLWEFSSLPQLLSASVELYKYIVNEYVFAYLQYTNTWFSVHVPVLSTSRLTLSIDLGAHVSVCKDDAPWVVQGGQDASGASHAITHGGSKALTTVVASGHGWWSDSIRFHQIPVWPAI